MVERVNFLRRQITTGIAFVLPAVTTGAVLGDIGLEVQTINQERSHLAGPANWLKNHNRLNNLRNEFEETIGKIDDELPPWTTLQALSLLDTVKFARNQFFVTPEEANKTIQFINTDGYLSINRSQNPIINQTYFEDSNSKIRASMTAIGANVGATAGYYGYIMNLENKRKQKKLSRNNAQINRRNFLKNALTVATLASALPAITGSILRPHYDRTDNLYEGIPSKALNALLDESNTQALDNFITDLTVPREEDFALIPPDMHKAITTEIMDEYQRELDSSSLTYDEQKLLFQRLSHAKSSDYVSYASRLETMSEIASRALPRILFQPPDDPVLTSNQTDEDPSIFNIGIGFILNTHTQAAQAIHHDIFNVDIYSVPKSPLRRIL